ncbi:MAG TPA: YbaN family protein [Ureibacillus sp.]|nr:YbaN family protein [Ureibacillus sp.]
MVIPIKYIKNLIFLLVGSISFVIGVLGIVVPLLPGVPFLIIAAFCFAKSSKRLDRKFKRTKLYKKYVRAFLYNKGMTLKEKIRINLVADFFILMSLFYVDNLMIKLLIMLAALYKHYYFFVRMKTI